MSQRVEKYTIEAQLENGEWKQIASGTTIGYKKIEHFTSVHTDSVRINIVDSRVCPILSFIGIYG